MIHKHHIIPKHAGGSNEASNLVDLSIEEHAEAHKILFQTYGRWQDDLAYKCLSGLINKEEMLLEINRQRWTPEARLERSLAMKGRKHSPDTIAKMSKARIGKKLTPETLEKKRLQRLGQKLSAETIAKRTASRKANKSL